MFDWIIKIIPNSMIKKYLGSVVRHCLTYIAGALAVIEFDGVQELAKLITDNMSSLESAIVAILVAAIGLLMSFVEKKQK